MVNEKYIISAIIPCYNVEKYIDRCLSSVVQQSIGMEHMQIILVNDASTDNTLEKLLLWETRYSDNILVQKFLNKWTIFLFCSILFSSNQKEH